MNFELEADYKIVSKGS